MDMNKKKKPTLFDEQRPVQPIKNKISAPVLPIPSQLKKKEIKLPFTKEEEEEEEETPIEKVTKPEVKEKKLDSKNIYFNLLLILRGTK